MPLRHHSPMTAKTLSQHICHTITRLTELQDEAALKTMAEAFVYARDACLHASRLADDEPSDESGLMLAKLTHMKVLFRKVE